MNTSEKKILLTDGQMKADVQFERAVNGLLPMDSKQKQNKHAILTPLNAPVSCNRYIVLHNLQYLLINSLSELETSKESTSRYNSAKV